MLKFFSLILFIISVPTANAININELSERLSREELLAEFRQEKSIKVLKRPLTSKGHLYLKKEKGLIWQVSAPIKSTTFLSQDSLKQFNSKDQLVAIEKGQASNISKQLSSIFLDLVSANFEALSEHFHIEVKSEISTKWTILLTPKKEPLLSFFKTIRLEGSQFIDKIIIEEVNQDITLISLSELDSTNEADSLGRNLEHYFEQ